MRSNSRIVLDLRSAHPGLTGIGRYALNLCLSLESAGTREICALVSEPALEFVQSHVESQVLAVPSASREWEDLVLPGVLRRLDARLYHTPLFILPAIRSCATVSTVHDAIPLARPDLTPTSFHDLFSAHVANAIRRSDAIVTVSNHSRMDLRKHLSIPENRLHVVEDSVSSRYCPTDGTRLQSVLRHYDLKPGYILSVGAFDRRKNLTLLLDAHVRLSKRRRMRPPLVFVGAPSGDCFSLEAEIKSRVLGVEARVLGRVSEEHLPALYSGAVALAFPSLYEGFGLPVIEAMACGTPVIAGRASAVPEIAGDAALFFDPTRDEDLAHQIETLIDSPSLQQELRARGLIQAGRFSLENQGRKLLHLYEHVEARAA